MQALESQIKKQKQCILKYSTALQSLHYAINGIRFMHDDQFPRVKDLFTKGIDPDSDFLFSLYFTHKYLLEDLQSEEKKLEKILEDANSELQALNQKYNRLHSEYILTDWNLASIIEELTSRG